MARSTVSEILDEILWDVFMFILPGALKADVFEFIGEGCGS